MARRGKPGQGRRKIEIKKIESEEARQVCFSKRRIGVFNKASELSTMCGAHVAVLVYSPSGTPYSFGSPSVDSVADSFLTQSPARAPVDSTREDVVNKLNKQYMEVSDQIAAEKEKKAMLEERMKEAAKVREFQWLQKIDQLGLDELSQLLPCLYRAKNSLNARINALLCHAGHMSTVNMGMIHGMPLNMGRVHGGMAQWAPPPPPSSGAIIEPLNCVPNALMPGSL